MLSKSWTSKSYLNLFVKFISSEIVSQMKAQFIENQYVLNDFLGSKCTKEWH